MEAVHPSDSLVLLRMEPPKGFAFQAGQWTYVFLPGSEERRAYSIASPPSDGASLEFCVKRVPGGPASNFMCDLAAGASVEFSQPLGSYRFTTPPSRTAVFLATGTGVAPHRSMIRENLARRGRSHTWLFLGSGKSESLPYHDEFLRMAQDHPGFHYVPVLSRGPLDWQGDRGWIQEAFLKHFYRRTDFDAYVCGLKRMVEDVKTLLHGQGLEDKHIHLERYD